VETLTYSSGRASGCDSPGLLNALNELKNHEQEGATSENNRASSN
jgi:hypothetical protein